MRTKISQLELESFEDLDMVLEALNKYASTYPSCFEYGCFDNWGGTKRLCPFGKWINSDKLKDCCPLTIFEFWKSGSK